MIFPASASGGRFSEDKISDELPAVDSFRSAIKLANEMKVAIVVMDPNNVWKEDGVSSTPRSTTECDYVSKCLTMLHALSRRTKLNEVPAPFIHL